MDFKMGFKLKVPKVFKSVKYLLGAANTALLFVGWALLLLGIVVYLQFCQYEDLITNKFFTISSFVMATGVLIILGCALGYYAAWSEKFLFIASYIIILAVILVFEMSIVIVASKMQSNVGNNIRSTMVQSLNDYGTKTEVSKLWDELHMEFGCCGAINFSDFGSGGIPVSCCHIDVGTISPFECTVSNVYSGGCAAALGDWLADYGYIMFIMGLTVMVLQVPILAIACYAGYRAKFVEVELES